MELTDPISCLKGVGDKTGQKLEKIGIYTLQDLIEYYPREYEDHRTIQLIQSCLIDEPNTILATICTTPQLIKVGYKVMVTFKVKDKSGQLSITFFGQPYLKNQFKIGETYLFYGKIKAYKNQYEMNTPDYYLVKSEEDLKKVATVTPIYKTTATISQKIIRKFIQECFKEVLSKIQDDLPISIRQQYQLVEKQKALQDIHFPESYEAFIEARKRLVFEELFMLQLYLYQLKADFNKKVKGIAHLIQEELKHQFISTLPFKLTKAQQQVIEEIIKDMQSPYAMNRLVQGDVGSGKTVIAAIALFLVVQDGFQGALMVPTEVLALQHYEFISQLMEPFKIRVSILTGSTTAKKKRDILQALQLGMIDILIGTHALIEDYVEMPKLGLVITDEQHRFGVRQRLKLTMKGIVPDVLVMTATPIPRTLALILYGDMDISIINEMPSGRKPIKTNAVSSSYHPRIYQFIRKQIEEDRQCYIICPMVEENEKITELKNVIDYTDYLKTQVFSSIPIGFLHGKMRAKEKNEIMSAFVKNELKVLVSTTVIEVGVNVPNATVMVIENAERFGLAQLHQLRGRVGRGEAQSYCILVSDSKNKLTKQRLKIMQESTNGFKIAETDLQLRGPGDFFGTRQHGLPEMKIANLYTDSQLLKEVQQCIWHIFNTNDDLEEQEALLELIKNRIDKSDFSKAL